MNDKQTSGKHRSAESREILEYLLSQRGEEQGRRFRIEPAPARDFFPLSRSQQRLWLLEQLEPGNPALNFMVPLQLPGNLDSAILERCLLEMARRHEVLRTSLDLRGGEPVQIVNPEPSLELRRLELQDFDPGQAMRKANECVSALWHEPFDLIKGPLLRYQLLQLPQTKRWLVISMHHIITDRISIAILISEITALYAAYSKGESSPLPEPTIQYRDYAVWERETLTDEILEPHLVYWRHQLADLPTLSLPNDHARPPLQTFHGARELLELPIALASNLKKVARAHRATPFMALIAAFFVLLNRYSGQTDVVVGTPTANRNLPELDRLIGFFLTTLVLRLDLSGNPSFSDVLERVRKTTLDAHAHQDVSFERLLEDLQPVRDLSRTPLFQVFFAHLERQGNAGVANETEAVRHENFLLSTLQEMGATQFDLEMYVADTATGLKVSVVYNPDLFAGATVRQMLGHYGRIVEAMVADPAQLVGTAPLLSASERQQLLKEWNETASEYPGEKCVHRLFEEQALRTPDAIAIGFEGQHLSYAELDARANQVAHLLLALKCRVDDRVGICMERSLELVVAMFGVLKAGACYVPLDPAFPHERLSFMMRDADIRVLLTQGRVSAPSPGSDCRVVDVEAEEQAVAAQKRTAPDVQVLPRELAYVIYTSG
ncbi:MAG: AMP-binding protein, partial [Gammaproteobacteria bacterium]|nr:AMP-binding protein [Gammaproteobacteria bacterium]